MTDLQSKISEIEAFERTPAGAALKRYRDAVSVLVMTDEAAHSEAWDRARNATRTAEHALRVEIQKLQPMTGAEAFDPREYEP